MDLQRDGMLVLVGLDRLLLGPERLEWKGRSVAWEEITGVAMGEVPVFEGKGVPHYVISLIAGEALLQIDWVQLRLSTRFPEVWPGVCFDAVSRIVFEMAGTRISDGMLAALKGGSAIVVGPLRADADGLTITEVPPGEGIVAGLDNFLSAGKERIEPRTSRLPWAELETCQLDRSRVEVYRLGQEEPWWTLPTYNTWNAVLFPDVLRQYAGSRELEEEAREDPAEA